MPLEVARWDSGGRGLAICATTAWNGLGFTPHQIWAFRRAQIAAHILQEQLVLGHRPTPRRRSGCRKASERR